MPARAWLSKIRKRPGVRPCVTCVDPPNLHITLDLEGGLRALLWLQPQLHDLGAVRERLAVAPEAKTSYPPPRNPPKLGVRIGLLTSQPAFAKAA